MTSEMAAEFYAAPHFRHRKRYDPIPFAPAHQTVWVNDKMQKKRRYGRRGGGRVSCNAVGTGGEGLMIFLIRLYLGNLNKLKQ